MRDRGYYTISIHGESFKDRDDFGHQITLYEEVVRVPLIIAGPGVAKGRRVTDLVETVDILPTIAELLGWTAPAGLDGRSLAGHLTEGAPSAPGAERPSPAHLDDGERSARSLRTAEWTYVENDTTGRRELYDRRTDRSETRDLSGTHAAEMERLAEERRALMSGRKKTPAGEAGAADEEALKRLKSLGYAN